VITASIWAWSGWNALVAVGTLLLADVTAILAAITYRVSKDSRAEITLERRRLEAGQRSIVLPASVVVTFEIPSSFRGKRLELRADWLDDQEEHRNEWLFELQAPDDRPIMVAYS
jgi:hypothetical protein